MQVVPVWCLVQFDAYAGLFKLVQVGVVWCNLWHVGVVDTVRYGVVNVGAVLYRLVHVERYHEFIFKF